MAITKNNIKEPICTKAYSVSDLVHYIKSIPCGLRNTIFGSNKSKRNK